VATVSNDDRQPTDKPSRPSRRDQRAASARPARASAQDPGTAAPPADKVAAEAAAIYPDTFETPPSQDEIAAEAYAIYQLRGGDHGRDEEDWLEAERRLKEPRKSR